MSRHLLVAIADVNHIDQVKQLFSSVYWNAGWKGDYMLMAHDIPSDKLEWFRSKGIIVRPCGPIHKGKESGIEYPPVDPSISKEMQSHISRFRFSTVFLNKFELFTPEFKKWDTVLYLDSDIIVRYSLDRLIKVSGFYAVPDVGAITLGQQFHKNVSKDDVYATLENEFDLSAPAFNSGVMAFSTDIIKDDSFDELKRLFYKYYSISSYGEQPIINLYFYRKWKKMYYLYNLYYIFFSGTYGFNNKKINSAAIHFCGFEKPWLPGNIFYSEWKVNLAKADKINLKERPISKGKIETHYILRCRYWFAKINFNAHLPFNFASIDRYIGLVGLSVKNRWPKLYEILGRNKLKGKHLLVAIADINHIDQAKQLFSSVYWNAGWKGDYMLMAHDIPEVNLEWFRSKGIIVRPCGPLHKGKESGIEYPPVDPSLPEDIKFHMNKFKSTLTILNKFELFTPEFKKWDTVLYLDSDIIVRYSLDRLIKVSGFYAASEGYLHKMKTEFRPSTTYDPLIKEIYSKYNMRAPAFNSGVMAFSTDIIKDDSFDELKRLFYKYYRNCVVYGEQSILNMYFYKRWKKMNFFYNIPVIVWADGYNVKLKNIDGAILHFFGIKKPWDKRSPFYKEWQENFKKSDDITLKSRPVIRLSLRSRVVTLFFWYKNKVIISLSPPFLRKYIGRLFGLVGIFLKKYFPKVYRSLKKD